MINFGMGDFWEACRFLVGELHAASQQAGINDSVVDEAVRTRVETNVRFVVQECVEKLELESAWGACRKTLDMFTAANTKPSGPQFTYQKLANALERLYEEIEHAAKQESFFHYPRELAKIVRGIGVEWKDVLDAFPSSRREIETGIDCYALGDFPGCVFHMMRIGELGLRTIARERGIKSLGKKKSKPIEWGTWQEVFDAIESQLKAVRQGNPGPKRDAAVSFYDTALGDLRTLRGLYRDPTMHFRENYDKGEAYSAIFRVQSLMRALSSKLREDRARKIPWGL
jgi:hypothetical protein